MSDEDAQKHLTQLFPKDKYANFYADYWLHNLKQENAGNLTLHNLISALSKRENLFNLLTKETMSGGLMFKTSEEKMRQLLPMLKKSINPPHAIGK